MPTGLCATQGPGLAGNLEEAQRCGEDDERRRQGPAVCGDHGHVAAVLFQGSDGCRRWGLDRGLAGSWAASGKAQVALPPTSSEVITPALPPGTHESKDASCPVWHLSSTKHPGRAAGRGRGKGSRPGA